MNLFLILALLFGPYPCPVKRDAAGHIVRSAAARKHFLWAHGGLLLTPKDSVVDHVIPLCGCGSDTPDNMQMQGVAEAKAKDVLEKRACYKLAHAVAAPVESEPSDANPLTRAMSGIKGSLARNRKGEIVWAMCVYCHTPYEAEDLRSIGYLRFVCRWHFARGER